MILEFKDYISLFALGISGLSLFLSTYDKKIKLDAYPNFSYPENSIDIYNNSSRKITISYFQLYQAKFKYFSKRDFANTWYDDNDDTKYVIAPFESKNIKFTEMYDINNFLQKRKGKHIYIALFVSGKKAKTITLI